MAKFTCEVRFTLNGQFEESDTYHVDIPDNTPSDDIMDKLMDEVREILNTEFEGNEDWEEGNYNWTISNFWEKIV